MHQSFDWYSKQKIVDRNSYFNFLKIDKSGYFNILIDSLLEPFLFFVMVQPGTFCLSMISVYLFCILEVFSLYDLSMKVLIENIDGKYTAIFE